MHPQLPLLFEKSLPQSLHRYGFSLLDYHSILIKSLVDSNLVEWLSDRPNTYLYSFEHTCMFVIG